MEKKSNYYGDDGGKPTHPPLIHLLYLTCVQIATTCSRTSSTSRAKAWVARSKRATMCP
jgi:hypothetical protein